MLDGRRLLQRLVTTPALVADGLLAIGIVVVTAWLARSTYVKNFELFDGFALLLTCLINLPLVLRRRAPMLVLVVSCGAYSWFLFERYVPSLNLFGPLLALYSVAATRSTRTAAIGSVCTLAVIYQSGISWNLYGNGLSIAQAAIAVVVAWVFGYGTRRLAQSNDRLVLLTEQLRREQEQRAHHAVTAERLRIARELHDVVAHHMSVVSVQAGLARYVLPGDPATASGALTIIADTSHEALDEMRRMLAVLRVDEAEQAPESQDYDPAPGLSRLPDLVDRVQAAGVPVEVVTSGVRQPLAPGADLCAYRVIQESLTNVLKHARSATAKVELRFEPAQLTVRVSNTAESTVDSTGHAPGHGLIGMRERARLYGGAIVAQPLPNGFEVCLTLPVAAEQRGPGLAT